MSQAFYMLSIAKRLHRPKAAADQFGQRMGTYEASWSGGPIPGNHPGMVDHAPAGRVVVGAGPGAEHRLDGTIFALFGGSGR